MDSLSLEFQLTLQDMTIILNALHYYKKVDKRGNFAYITDEMINDVRDKMCKQLCPSPFNEVDS